MSNDQIPNRIIVKVNEEPSSITVYANDPRYWYNLSKAWAIQMGSKVKDEDYSSKQYSEYAKAWAEGTDEEVEALGGEHSAKGWSLTVEDKLSNQIAIHNADESAHEYIQNLIRNEAILRQNGDAALQTQLNDKVDKVAGKTLTTNDFTNAYKNKLDGIETGAQVNTVLSVNGQVGYIQLTASDVGALPEGTQIGDAIFTIKQNGIAKGSFTANSVNNAEANIEVPTKLSELDNTETDFVNKYYVDTKDTNLQNQITANLLAIQNEVQAREQADAAIIAQIPEVGSGTITVMQGDEVKGAFNLNQDGDYTLRLSSGGGLIEVNFSDILGSPYDNTSLAQALNSKQPTISDLATIRSGAAAGATALQSSDVVNAVDQTDTDKPLSANMGKELQDQINNLSARGRFLALWDCTTGLAETHPTVSPYEYKTGDYFIVGVVAQTGGTNYRPSGSSYTDNVPSTAIETAEVSVDDVYYYDGNIWHLQVNTQKTLSFDNIAGSPYDNSSLAAALNDKQDELIEGAGITITDNTVSNAGVRAISTGSTNGTISVNTNGTSAEVSVAGLGTAAFTSSTDYATAAQGALADSAVQDVQINSTSILSGGVANIPKGTSSVLGVFKVSPNQGVSAYSTGDLCIISASEPELTAKTQSYKPIVPSKLDIAVREGLGNNSLTWTDAYKASARNTIGATQAVFVDWSD